MKFLIFSVRMKFYFCLLSALASPLLNYLASSDCISSGMYVYVCLHRCLLQTDCEFFEGRSCTFLTLCSNNRHNTLRKINVQWVLVQLHFSVLWHIVPTVVAHTTSQLPQFWETQPIELKTHRLQKEDKIKHTDCLSLEKDYRWNWHWQNPKVYKNVVELINSVQ